MFVLQTGNVILVHDGDGRVVYKSGAIHQVERFSEGKLLIVTDESIDYITEVDVNGSKQVVYNTDTNFQKAFLVGEYLFILRKVLVPSLDIVDSNFQIVARLHLGINEDWVYYKTTLGIPTKFLTPIRLTQKCLYLSHKADYYKLDFKTGLLSQLKDKKVTNNNLQPILQKFKIGGQPSV